MQRPKQLNKLILAALKAPMADRGYSKCHRDLFVKATNSGFEGVRVTFLQYNYLGVFLEYCVRYDLVTKAIVVASDVIATKHGWSAQEIENGKKNAKWDDTYRMSYNPLMGLYKFDTDDLTSELEVESTCRKIVAKYDSTFESFFSKFQDIDSVAQMFEQDDPFLNLIFYGSPIQRLTAGLATLRAVRGLDSAVRYAQRNEAHLVHDVRRYADIFLSPTFSVS